MQRQLTCVRTHSLYVAHTISSVFGELTFCVSHRKSPSSPAHGKYQNGRSTIQRLPASPANWPARGRFARASSQRTRTCLQMQRLRRRRVPKRVQTRSGRKCSMCRSTRTSRSRSTTWSTREMSCDMSHKAMYLWHRHALEFAKYFCHIRSHRNRELQATASACPCSFFARYESVPVPVQRRLDRMLFLCTSVLYPLGRSPCPIISRCSVV